MVEKWVEGVKGLAKVTTCYPQLAYHGSTQSLQSEWQYLCRCVLSVEAFLRPVEEAIRRYFVHAMQQKKARAITDKFRQLLAQWVK